MIRASLFTAAAAFCLAPAAQADHNYYNNHGGHYGQYGHQPSAANVACERQKDQDKLAGGVVGAIAGGLIGVAIGGELEPGNGYHRRKGYRRHRGYHGYHGGYHGYRGHRRGGYYHDRGDDGAEIAGGLIGAVAGAAIGSSLAGDSTKCGHTYQAQGYAPSGYHGVTLHDVHAPTRSPSGPAWENPRQQQSTQPAYPQPAAAPPAQDYPDYNDFQQDDLYGAPDARRYERDCRTVHRETRLPDGGLIREPVEVCQSDDGSWQVPGNLPNY